ncbi:hypothetical protein EH165_14940 [Nakamurella antarctica]|uniref:Uncharacterized protein n=1 Tax=Nakamurella antarctica TaxID=1902245 RepID=A0A3G8ZPP5_9ACTN|nr:hypothetical protein [Nakamurella antarctica]AZI59243.1 hypothetical protein EH165_14940 [Nakamurella antarctica]
MKTYPSPARSPLQKWADHWNGPIFVALGTIWLAITPLTDGAKTIRWVIGVLQVALGATMWIMAWRHKSED